MKHLVTLRPSRELITENHEGVLTRDRPYMRALPTDPHQMADGVAFVNRPLPATNGYHDRFIAIYTH